MSISKKKLIRIEEFINAIKLHGLSVQDDGHALSAGKAYARLLWVNPTGVYRDDDFEENLISRHEGSFELGLPLKNKVLHLVSMPYQSGGHTRLLEKLVSLLPEESDVLVAWPFVMDACVLRVAESVNVFCRPDGYTIAALAEILSRYDVVVLHIHPDDLMSSVAIGLARRRRHLRVIFINHADHAFSYGLCSADIVAEVSSFGSSLSQNKRSVVSSFLGIPVASVEFSPCRISHNRDALHIFSAGSTLKFRPSNGYSFPQLVQTILRSLPNAKMTVIGPSIKNVWWWLPKIFFPHRLKLYSVLPYKKYMELVREADIYIDSVPMGGGTALPEVRAQGIPVTGLLTGALGYTPFDEAKFSQTDDLLFELKKFSRGESTTIVDVNNSPQLLSAAFENHNLAEVGKRFRKLLAENIIFNAPGNIIFNDVTFYEKQWVERGMANIDRDVIAYVFELKGEARRKVMGLMIGAMSWRQRFRLFFRYVSIYFK